MVPVSLGAVVITTHFSRFWKKTLCPAYIYLFSRTVYLYVGRLKIALIKQLNTQIHFLFTQLSVRNFRNRWPWDDREWTGVWKYAEDRKAQCPVIWDCRHTHSHTRSHTHIHTHLQTHTHSHTPLLTVIHIYAKLLIHKNYRVTFYPISHNWMPTDTLS